MLKRVTISCNSFFISVYLYFKYTDMKKILVLFLLVSFIVKAQVYEVLVETKHKIDYTEKGLEFFKNIQDPEQRKWNIEQNSNPPALDFKIYSSKTEQNTFEQEKINNEQEYKGSIKKSVPGLSFGYSYTSFSENANYLPIDIYGKKYTIKSDLKKLEWNFTSKTKDILGYKTYKATTKFDKFDLEIWFTKDIPFNFMPANIQPIDGFVLEMNYYIVHEVGKINNFVRVQSLKEIDKYKFKKASNAPIITEEDSEKLFEEANKKRNEMYNNNNDVDKK